MDSRRLTATRLQEIAPFHVMEVQTAGRALEAAGGDVVPRLAEWLPGLSR